MSDHDNLIKLHNVNNIRIVGLFLFVLCVTLHILIRTTTERFY